MHSTIFVLSENTDFKVDANILYNDADINKVVRYGYVGAETLIEKETSILKDTYSNILNVGKDEKGFFISMKNEEARLQFVSDIFKQIEELVKEGSEKIEKREITSSIFLRISEKLPLEQEYPLVYCKYDLGMTLEYFLMSVMDCNKKYYITQTFDYCF